MRWVVFITAILSVPDHMRAGKTIAILTFALSAWYLLAERRRFAGPMWAGDRQCAHERSALKTRT